MAAKAIIISTSRDGAMNVVGEVMPLSEAKAKLRTFEGEEFKKVELFDLRSPAKRRKLNRKPAAPAAPTFEQIVEQLASGEVELAEDDFTKKTGIPKVGAFNQAFGTKLARKAIADIWAEVQELQIPPPEGDEVPNGSEDNPPEE